MESVILDASVGKHLALAPVAFAVIDGDAHAILYANALFRHLQSAGQIRVSDDGGRAAGADLTPLLETAARSRRTIRDAILEPPHDGAARLVCSIWPVADSDGASSQLVVEVRDVALIEGAKERQRAIAQEVLLGGLQAQDAAGTAAHMSERARFLAKASRDLSLSLDEQATRDTMRRLALPRPGTWCIVDVVESNGAMHRLAVIQPDAAKQALARRLEEEWPSDPGKSADVAPLMREPTIVTADSGPELLRAVHGDENLRILREIGFGALLVVPLIVRARVQGAITFVSPKGSPPFAPDEIELGVDLAARCAIALENARLYHEADMLRVAAEEANRSKSQFLRTMSHELRTPLNAIAGFTELLEMGVEGPVTAKQRDALARIKANEQQLLKLITEILNFVRIESGRMQYHFGRVSLTEALADMVALLSVTADKKKLTLRTASADTEVTAWADSDRVRQILLNLVMNALKYTPAGGTVTLSCDSIGDTVVARVTDTGPGIEAKRTESIFEPFVQLKAELTDQSGGVGLGLPISRDLARAMKGDITVESTVGVGSSFELLLPRAPRSAAVRAMATAGAN